MTTQIKSAKSKDLCGGPVRKLMSKHYQVLRIYFVQSASYAKVMSTVPKNIASFIFFVENAAGWRCEHVAQSTPLELNLTVFLVVYVLFIRAILKLYIVPA